MPVNALTCDTDGNGENDGNRLFSREPLLAHVQVCEGGCGGGGAGRDLWIIVVHLKSKSEDTKNIPYTLPRRLAQAQFVAGMYAEVLAGEPDAEVIALGDFNDFYNSQPMGALTGIGLVNLMQAIPHAQAYTYNFQGVSQVLDYILVSPGLLASPGMGFFPSIAHLNADYPVVWEGNDTLPRRASDHEPVLLHVVALSPSIWLPVVNR